MLYRLEFHFVPSDFLDLLVPTDALNFEIHCNCEVGL